MESDKLEDPEDMSDDKLLEEHDQLSGNAGTAEELRRQIALAKEIVERGLK